MSLEDAVLFTIRIVATPGACRRCQIASLTVYQTPQLQGLLIGPLGYVWDLDANMSLLHPHCHCYLEVINIEVDMEQVQVGEY